MNYYFTVSGKYVFVNQEDFFKLSRYKWMLKKDGRIHAKINGNFVLIHRFILCAPKGTQIDHIDGNPLNNVRSNLRLCTNSQNQMNTRKRSGCKTDFKGVTYRRKWFELNVNGKFIRRFSNAVDAAMGYDIISKQLYGEFCRPNFPNGFSNQDFARISNLLNFKKEGLSYFTSKYKGIGFHKNSGKWRAREKIDGEWKTLGYHKTEEEALKQLRDYHEHNSK